MLYDAASGSQHKKVVNSKPAIVNRINYLFTMAGLLFTTLGYCMTVNLADGVSD